MWKTKLMQNKKEVKKDRLIKWCHVKLNLSEPTKRPFYFKEREVWWVYFGENLGFEQNGGSNFSRPAVVVSKYNLDLALVLPLTSSKKENKFYFDIGEVAGKKAQVILSQARVLDRTRFQDKIMTITKDKFNEIILAFKDKNFPLTSSSEGEAEAVCS